jgi:hypothetical protein
MAQGYVYTELQDANITQIGGATFVLGQQLEAASIPIVLTSAQISTLTPPAQITNFAQETGGNLATLAGGVSGSKYQIRSLTSVSDSVEVKQSTGSNLHTVIDSGSVTVNTITGFATETTLGLINGKLVSGTDIGDVTINNTSGAGAVNIQDGGNTITVDGSVTVPLITGFALETGGNLATLAGGVTGSKYQIRALTSADVVDVSDRAARLLGVVYGSQGQQLKQTATNYNTQVELATGATLYDARQIRALTSSDTVTAVQATGSNLHTVIDSGTITTITNAVKTNADGTIDAGTAPANSLIVGGIYNSSPITLTTGQGAALQTDVNGYLKVVQPSTGSLPQTYVQNLYNIGQGFHVATNTITVSGTGENAFFYLTNPNASGKTVRITDIIIGVDKGALFVVSQFRFYRDPTITVNGTALTISKAKKSQSAASVCSAYSSPTASANGTLFKLMQVTSGLNNYECVEMEIIIEANEKLLITVQGGTTNSVHSVSISFVEV